MSTHSHHTYTSRRSHTSSRPAQDNTVSRSTSPPTNHSVLPPYSDPGIRAIMLSPASLTLKFDAIFDVPEGDEALSDTTLPLLFRPLSPRPVSESIGFPVSYSYDTAPVIQEIMVTSPSSGASTLTDSPTSTGHAGVAQAVSQVTYVSSAGSTRSHHSGHSGHHHHHHHRNGSAQHVYAQPARSVRSSGSVATTRGRPQYERAKSSGVTMTVIPATPRRISQGSIMSYRPERDEHGKVKLSTKIRRLFGLGPKREEVADRGRTQYVYPSASSARRSTSRVVYSS